MEEIPIKTELTDEEFSDFTIEENPLNVELKKDIPDLVNASNFAGISEELEIYYCSYCKKKYGKFEYLQLHEYVHDASKHCPMCNFTFTAKKDFIIHINGHIKEKMEDERRSLFCEFCKKTFRKRRALMNHLRVHTNERPYECHTCGKTFKQKGALTDHNITHSTNTKPFPCEVCSGSFTTASSLRRHIKRIHDAGKTYFCKICSQKLDNYTCLQLHRAEKHPEASERRRCTICSMVFKSMYSFNKHRKVHESNNEIQKKISTSTTKYRCILCGEKFSNYKLHVEHRDGHYHYTKEDFQKAQESGLFRCKLCERDFETKNGLYKHLPFHMDKNEKCNICQEFFSYYGYTSHKRRVHLPLECKICKKIVEGSGRLIRHYRIVHADLNRKQDGGEYACNICDKLYKSKYPLDMHIQIYHGKSDIIKTHKCNICGKQFTTRASLGIHMTRVHPASARFKCDACNVILQSRSKLLRHNIIYHKGTVKKQQKNKLRHCTHCSKVFRTVSLLEHHKKTKHKIVKPATKFQCKICLKYFQNFRTRMIHLENKVCTKFFEKTKKTLYSCTICERDFAYKTFLIDHMVVHSKFYKTCRFCNNTYSSTRNLRIHIESVHPSEKVYYCGFCNMEIDDLRQLSVHRHLPSHKAKVECTMECNIKVAVESDVTSTSINEEKIIKEDEIKEEPVD